MQTASEINDPEMKPMHHRPCLESTSKSILLASEISIPLQALPNPLFVFFVSRLRQLVTEVTKKDIPAWQKAVVFEICVTDEADEDVEVPYVRYVLGN